MLVDIITRELGPRFIANATTVVECGSHYGEDTIMLASTFPKATVYGFECNPNTLQKCREAVRQISRIRLTESALSDIDGKITFYPINKEKTKTTWPDGNQGASSIYRASGLYDGIEAYVQDEVTVDSTRLDTFCGSNGLSKIDFLWLDAQGAELRILTGLGCYLAKVAVLKCEVEFREQYAGQPLWPEVRKFLELHGFRFVQFYGHPAEHTALVEKRDWFADAVFVNTSL